MQEAQEDVLNGESGTCLNESVKKEVLRVIDVVGGHGPWQFRHWAIFCLATFCTSLHLFSTLPFINIPLRCDCQNASDSAIKHPTVLQSCNSTSCNTSADHLWSELHGPCFSPKPPSLHEHSEVDDFPCSNVALVFSSKCLFVLGSLLSACLAYTFIERFGRRSVSLVSCFLLASCSLAGVWATAPGTYLVLKFILSFGITNVYLIAAFSLADCVNEEFRLLYFYTAHIGWGLAHFILPLASWIVPNWIIYNIILSVPCFLLFIILCFLPETAESYAAKGLFGRAHKVMRRAARCNGHSLQGVEQFSPNLLVTPTENCETVFTFDIKNNNCFSEHTALFVIGFSSSFIYFTSLWLTDWLQTKRDSYFSLMGTTEIAAVFVMLFFSYFVPFRRLWAMTTCLASLFLVVMYVREKNVVPKLSRSTYIVEMFFASASWTAAMLCCLCQPLLSKKAKCRSLMLGLGLCFGLLGSALLDLQKMVTWNKYQLLFISVPNLIIGLCIGLIPRKYLDISHS